MLCNLRILTSRDSSPLLPLLCLLLISHCAIPKGARIRPVETQQKLCALNLEQKRQPQSQIDDLAAEQQVAQSILLPVPKQLSQVCFPSLES